MTENDPYVVAIDGPGGSGKGSLALRIAKILGFHKYRILRGQDPIMILVDSPATTST